MLELSSSFPDRQLIVLSGAENWAKKTAKKLVSDISEEAVYCYESSDGSRQLGDIHRLLGQDYQALIYSMFSGFDPDSLAAGAGTIIAGGYLILLTPDFEDWPSYQDPYSKRFLNWPHSSDDVQQRFIQRFIDYLLCHKDQIVFLTEQANAPKALVSPSVERRMGEVTEDQWYVLKHLKQFFKSDCAHPPIVVSADRGRGKSAVLGVFLRQQKIFQASNIIVTAPKRKTLHSLEKHAAPQVVNYQPFDEILGSEEDYELVIVDEAASFGIDQLEALIKKFPRVVLITTLHGYEGSGRGFAIRLSKFLNKSFPAWQHLKLQQPIRYKEHDRLELLINDLFMLNVDLPDLPRIDAKALQYQTITGASLYGNETLLRGVYSLLVGAHYQTRPSDLRHMLDGIGVTFYLALHHDKPLAVAMSIREGGFDDDLSQDIFMGHRRPRGNLAPQTLIYHLGIPQAGQLLTERVMRIVVHPSMQNRGVGSDLLAFMQGQSREVDYWSASFALTGERIVHFWRKSGFSVTRVGLRTDKSSGRRSMLVTKSNGDADSILKSVQQQFYRQFYSLRRSNYAWVKQAQIKQWNIQKPTVDRELLASELEGFARGQRGFEISLFALQSWYQLLSSNYAHIKANLQHDERRLLELAVEENVSWQEMARVLHFSGKKQILHRLRELVKHINQQMELPQSNESN